MSTCVIRRQLPAEKSVSLGDYHGLSVGRRPRTHPTIFVGIQGRRKELFKGGGGGVVLNAIFQKGYFFTDLFPNILYRKCIQFAPKKGGSSDPSDPPLPTPLESIYFHSN